MFYCAGGCDLRMSSSKSRKAFEDRTRAGVEALGCRAGWLGTSITGSTTGCGLGGVKMFCKLCPTIGFALGSVSVTAPSQTIFFPMANILHGGSFGPAVPWQRSKAKPGPSMSVQVPGCWQNDPLDRCPSVDTAKAKGSSRLNYFLNFSSTATARLMGPDHTSL